VGLLAHAADAQTPNAQRDPLAPGGGRRLRRAYNKAFRPVRFLFEGKDKPEKEAWVDAFRRLLGSDPLLCPKCGQADMVVVQILEPISP
jgi:hypothetical protein